MILSDVLAVQPAPGATEAAQYQHFAGSGPWTASIYRPGRPGTREFRTLLDGFDMANLQGDYAALANIAGTPGRTTGRLDWFDDVTTQHFALCARRGPVVGVGDLPGVEGAASATRISARIRTRRSPAAT